MTSNVYSIIVLALFFVVSTAGLAALVYVLQLFWPELRAHLVRIGREKEAAFVDHLVQLAVAQAEQLGEDNAGKKRLAVEFLERELAAYGIDIDLARVDALIEAGVYNLLKQWQGVITEELVGDVLVGDVGTTDAGDLSYPAPHTVHVDSIREP